MIITRSILITKRNVSEKVCREKNIHLRSVTFFLRKLCRLWECGKIV